MRPVHRLPRRAPHHQAHQRRQPVNGGQIRETCGKLPRQRMSASPARFGMPDDRLVSFRLLLPRSGNQERLAKCRQLRQLPRRAQHPALLPTQINDNAKNLPKTCGKCHAGAGPRFALGTIHSMEGGKEPKAVLWAREFYLLVIPLTIGLMLLHNLGDWIRKLIDLRFPAAGSWGQRVRNVPRGLHHREFRMHFLERAQHALLAVSFGVLVWTGFALKFPGEWWARPLMIWESSWPVRGVVHRVAAAVMVVVSMFHFASLLASRQLREHWKHLLPRPRDATEALLNFAYNLGSAPNGRSCPRTATLRRPNTGRWCGARWSWQGRAWCCGPTTSLCGTCRRSGLILPPRSISMKRSWPRWPSWSGTSIPIVFDPDVYPLNTAFLTGKTVKKQAPSIEHPKPPAPAAGD